MNILSTVHTNKFESMLTNFQVNSSGGNPALVVDKLDYNIGQTYIAVLL